MCSISVLFGVVLVLLIFKNLFVFFFIDFIFSYIIYMFFVYIVFKVKRKMIICFFVII